MRSGGNTISPSSTRTQLNVLELINTKNIYKLLITEDLKWWRRGSRTPVRKALRHEAYMLSSIPLGSPAALRMSKKRGRLVRWFSPSLTDRKARTSSLCDASDRPMSKAGEAAT